VDLGAIARRVEIQTPVAKAVILLDTNALLWLQQDHPRAARLTRSGTRLYSSPASLLEIQFLLETGRVRLRPNVTVLHLTADDRWLQDDPPSVAWFGGAVAIDWTRDPFDRLLVAHARLRRWRLATSDVDIMEHLAPHEYLEL
jgi:PIN domain nuclease of toxin-antitoxin system